MARLYHLVIVACFLQSACSQLDEYMNTERNRRILDGSYEEHIPSNLVLSLANWISSSSARERTGRAGSMKAETRESDEEKNYLKASFEEEDEDEEDALDWTQHFLKSLREGMDPGAEAASDTCLKDTERFIAGIQGQELWALQMLDAFGKPGSDILRGQLGFLGSYDECFSVVTNKTNVDFNSRYCKVTFYPQSVLNQTVDMTSAAIVFLGLCLPDTCSTQDLNIIFYELLTPLNVSMIAAADCYEESVPFDTKAIVAIVICSVFGVLVVLGTAYDVLFIEMQRNTKEDSKNASPTDKYGSLSDGKKQHTTSEKVPLLNDSTTVSVDQTHVVEDPILKPENEKKRNWRQETIEGEAVWIQILLSFSAYNNGAKLLNTNQSPGALTAVHGIRFLSITWVILGHCFSTLMSYGSAVAVYLQEHVKWWTFHGILNALVSVDTFFALSGLLVSYLTLKELKKGSGKINWFMFYFHRFWRLTPVYMMMLMFYVCLFRYLGDGPLWAQAGVQTQECEDNWWTNLLYVNNVVNRDRMCFTWAWYLANDMQFYILSPLIIVPLYYSKYLGMAVMGIFMLATMLTAGLITRLNNLPAGFLYVTDETPGPDDYLSYYMTPYCRMGPYLAGIYAGYFLYKNQGKPMSYKLSICGWLIATASALAVLYGPYDSANGTPMTSDVASLYNAVHRTVWGAAVCWVVVACATGSGGYVNTLMSWNGFVPLSRLCYCAYLTHPMIIIHHLNTDRSILYLTDVTVIYNFLAYLVATYGVSFIVSLVFEAPMMGLERVLFKRERSN